MTMARASASFLMLLAALLLAPLPRGFMPGAADNGVALVICSAGGVSSPVTADFGADHKPRPGAASTDCPFALPALGGAAEPLLPAEPLLLPLELVLVPLAPALVVRLAARLRPPAQAPPAPL